MISIIIPIRNEINHIELLIKSIMSQNISIREIDLIFCDGQSTDGSKNYINKQIIKYNNIKLILNECQYMPHGFNKGLSIAKGDIIIVLGGHSLLETDYLQNCIKMLDKTGADCVGGSTTHIATEIVGKAIVLAQSSLFGVGGVAFRSNSVKGQYVDTLAFGAYKRDVFEKLGGYDEELVRNQDDEFNFRLIQNGGKIWLDPSIQSKYYPRNSFIKLFKQYFQYGFYKIRVMQKRKGFASWRHLIPGLFVSSILLSIIFYLINGNPFSLKMIFIPYSIISLGFTLVSFFKSPKHILSSLLLPLTFFILHISYGLGFILGVFYFWNKWGDQKVKDTHFNKILFTNNS